MPYTGRVSRKKERDQRDTSREPPKSQQPTPAAGAETNNTGLAEDTGVLMLAATPIGNLSDASDRLRMALTEADVIAVEDTRKLRTLVSGLGVRTGGRILTNHDHNEAARAGELVEAVAAGHKVLLLSDAGMPTISDPGYVAAAAVAEAGLKVTVLPGASAALAALALSALPAGRFTFEGFLPRKGAERTRRLHSLSTEERTMIFYESPHRCAATLHDFARVFGPLRRAALCRELTKLHEQVLRAPLGELANWAENTTVRGEIVLVVGGAPAQEVTAQDALHLVLEKTAAGTGLKQACAEVAALTGASKRELYQAALGAKTTQKTN